MPEPSPSRSPSPLLLGGDIRQEALPIWTLRLAFLVLAVLTPLYGVIYAATSPRAVDPWSVRMAIVGLSLVGLAASYRVRAVVEHPRPVLAVVVVAAFAWFGWLTAANDLAPDYAIGFLVVVVATAMVVSIAWERIQPLAGVLLLAFGIGVVVAFEIDPAAADMDPLVFVTVLATGEGVVFFALQSRIRMAAALRASEARLAEAERLSGTGAWTLDTTTGIRTWSAGAYDVLGVSRSVSMPPSLSEFVHRDDVDLCREEYGRLIAGGGPSDLRFRIVRPDGTVRWLHSVIEFERRSGCFRGAFVDVTEQMGRECALAEALDTAETASRATNEFLANMSHEIRTPLTAIIGFAQLLREETGETHAAFVEPIENAGLRLLGTLNSVLDLARMEAGQTDLALVPTDLSLETREVIRMLRAQADAKGLPLHYEGAGGPVQALADPDAFGRILTNLLSNAVKFTEHGYVAVRLAADAGRAILEVEDTGRGMDPTFLNELFQPFRQASKGWARSHEGTGLGLTITRRLVEAMDGTIRVESRPGEGSRFTVAFPLLLAETRPVAVSARASAAA